MMDGPGNTVPVTVVCCCMMLCIMMYGLWTTNNAITHYLLASDYGCEQHDGQLAGDQSCCTINSHNVRLLSDSGSPLEALSISKKALGERSGIFSFVTTFHIVTSSDKTTTSNFQLMRSEKIGWISSFRPI